MSEPTPDDGQHLLLALSWLDLLLRMRVEQVRRLHGGDPWLRGMHLSDEDVDHLFGRPPGQRRWTGIDPTPALEAAIAQRARLVDEAGAAARAAGRLPPWLALVERFGLDGFEARVVLLTLAPEVDDRYSKFIAWLHDDVTQKLPTVGLALDLFGGDLAARMRARRYFAPDGGLVGSGLLTLGEAPHWRDRPLSLTPAAVRWLFGEAPVDPIAADAVTVRGLPSDAIGQSYGALGMPSPATPEGLAEHRDRLIAAGLAGQRRAVVVSGPAGSGRQAFAAAVAAGLGQPLYVLDLERLDKAEDARFDQVLAAAALAGRLAGAPLCVRRLGTLDATKQAARRTRLLRTLAERGPAMLFITADAPWHPQRPPRGLPPIEQAVIDVLPVDARAALWRRWAVDAPDDTATGDAITEPSDAIAEPSGAIAEPGDAIAEPSDAIAEPSDAIAEPGDAIAEPSDAIAEPSDAIAEADGAIEPAADADPLTEAIDAIADAFRFSPGRIQAAATTARGLARAAGRPRPTSEDLFRAARAHATPKLGALAQKVSTGHAWGDLVLAPDRRALLEEIIIRVQQRTRVIERWGFGRKVAGERGTSALFVGPSGTGKTLAAALIAQATRRDLYRIDLSQVVSKYIGETEKHLEKVFAEAEATDAALFFDEADALFGKRGEVKDAHDRYANIEVGYLLQRLERFSGLAVLATNLRRNMDEAFLRRLDVIVDFPLPDVEQRARLWAGVWPSEAPLDDDLDPADLAQRFDLSGGNIRNIALSAAYAAAHAGETIGLKHVLGAARSEYRKLNRLLDARRFAPETRKRR